MPSGCEGKGLRVPPVSNAVKFFRGATLTRLSLPDCHPLRHPCLYRTSASCFIEANIGFDDGRLGLKAHFSLVPDCENPYFIGGNDKAIKGDVSGMAIRNNQFSQFAFDPPADQRVCGEIVDRGLDGRDSIQRGLCVFVTEEFEGALYVIESPLGIDYRCHGLGRCALPSTARRCIQAWTSSAR